MATNKPDLPNILVIFGDEIGMWNLRCYGDGVMGYRTPNIDRLAKEGMKFTTPMVSKAVPLVARAS